MTTLILFSACFAFFMVEVLEWQRFHKLLNRRPFNCVPCLAAWTGLVSSLIEGEQWHSIYAMFIAGTLALFINKLLIKLF